MCLMWQPDIDQRTLDRSPPSVQNVCVYLRRAQVTVAQLLLHRPDISATLKQVRRK